MFNAADIEKYMESLRNDAQREILIRFFKTAPGEYGFGDEFIGLKVPQTREVVREVAKGISLDEVPPLLMSKWHEVRLCGFLILVAKFGKLTSKRLEYAEDAIRCRDDIIALYLNHVEQANNWDLVDLSAPKLLGHWLMLPTCFGGKAPGHHREERMELLDQLAASDNLWCNRISMVCTWKTTQMGDPSWCLRYAEKHLQHPHDLMHKAVGWMLREVGKRVSMTLLRDFLHHHAAEMPRTALRYAIEQMSDDERKMWMDTASLS